MTVTDGFSRCFLKVDAITIDKRLDVRDKGTDAEHVEMLTDALGDNRKLEPVTVWVVEDPPELPPGTYSFVTDGRHTLAAYKAAGRATVPCRKKHGTWTEAVVAAATSNQGKRGKPLTMADKKRAVAMLLEIHGDDSAEPWSDQRIADLAGMSRAYVHGARPKVQPSTMTGTEAMAKTVSDGDTKTDILPVTVTGQTASLRPARMGVDGKARHVVKKTSAADVSLDTVEKNKLVDAADYIWAAMRSAELATVGDAIAHFRSGGLCGLKPSDAADMRKDLERIVGTAPLVVATEYVKSGDPVFDFRRFDSHFGAIVRAVSDLRKIRPDLSGECDGLDAHLEAYLQMWKVLKEKFARTQEK